MLPQRFASFFTSLRSARSLFVGFCLQKDLEQCLVHTCIITQATGIDSLTSILKLTHPTFFMYILLHSVLTQHTKCCAQGFWHSMLVSLRNVLSFMARFSLLSSLRPTLHLKKMSIFLPVQYTYYHIQWKYSLFSSFFWQNWSIVSNSSEIQRANFVWRLV